MAATKEYVPEAEKKIVFDRFHVMRQVPEAVDKTPLPQLPTRLASQAQNQGKTCKPQKQRNFKSIVRHLSRKKYRPQQALFSFLNSYKGRKDSADDAL